jgi:hypothetical protein
MAGRKRELSQNTEKSERTISFPVFQGDLLWYNYLTSSSHQTAPNMMGRPNQSSGLGSTRKIKLAGEDDDIKALFFPMALGNMPLQWFDKLNLGSIRGWEDLQRAFCENFTGIITHPIAHIELKGLKQKGGESLRDYYRHFGELRA